jgi:hypothetical protein
MSAMASIDIVLAALVHVAAMAGGGTAEEFIQGSRTPDD